MYIVYERMIIDSIKNFLNKYNIIYRLYIEFPCSKSKVKINEIIWFYNKFY